MRDSEVPVEQVETVQEQVVQPEVMDRTSKIEYDFAALRRKAEDAERRAEEAERKAQQYEQSQQSVAQEEDDIAIDNEDYVQAKHVKTSNKNLKKQLTANEKRVAELEQKIAYFEAKVDTDSLKEFESVVNDESVQKLAQRYPSDYRSMMLNPNLRERSRTAYNMIKNYGISGPDTRDADRRIAENKQKPQLASLVSPQQPASTLAKFTDDGRRIMDDAERDRIMRTHERNKMSW